MNAEKGWRVLAASLVGGALVVLSGLGGLNDGLSGLRNSAGATGRSLYALVRPPVDGRVTMLERDSRHTPFNAVIFYGGYFCVRGSNGERGRRTVRLALALRELDALVHENSSAVGPFPTKDQARGEC